MKKITLLLLLMVTGKAQSQDTLEPFVCSYKCENTFAALRSTCTQAQSILNAIPLSTGNVNPYNEFKMVISLLTRLDAQQPFPLIYSFKPCVTVCNAASVTIDSLQYIYYNQTFLNQIRGQQEKVKWAIRCIIAHEIGHHVLGHTFPGYRPANLEEQRKNELRADHFSAFVIKHFPDATLEDAYEGLRTLDAATYTPQTESQESQKPYPILSKRYQAIQEGFDSLSNPVTLALYRHIDSVGIRYYRERGNSIILNVINELLTANNLKEASQKLQELKKNNSTFFDKENLAQTEQLINQQLKKFEKANIEAAQPLSPGLEREIKDVQIKALKNKYNNLKNGSIEQKIEADKIIQQIKTIKKEKNTISQ
ncbi:hypothetical protein [Chitinophaga sp. RAB17]|uniref:hypothetical protein n=1 Tax=Chitinophaga sp. RAB17 TaxID=3233049 RepID=UPI003F8ECC31